MSSANAARGTGIFGKVLAIMLIVAVLPTALVWYGGHRQETALLNKGIESRLRANADRLSQVTDGWLDAHFRMMKYAAAQPDMESMKGDKQRPLLVSMTDKYPYIYLAHTIRVDNGMNEARSDGKPLINYGDRLYVRDALGPKGIGFEAVIGKSSGLPAFVLGVPIMKDGKAVGVLSCALTVDDISKLVVDASIGQTGFSFLLDPNGKIVAHPEKEFAKTQRDFTHHPALLAFKADRPLPYFVDDESGKSIIAVAVGTKDGLTLISQQDAAEANAPIDEANRYAAMLLGGSIIVVIVLAFGFSRGFTDPIRSLTAASEAMSLGKMETQIPDTSRSDELGELARAIDRMGVSLKLSMAQLEEMATPQEKPRTAPSRSMPPGRRA